MWEDLQITNRLLYQLSYVGLALILNTRLRFLQTMPSPDRNAPLALKRFILLAFYFCGS